MKLIVGLGNPSNNYYYTRHNIGFRIVDRLISASQANSISKKSFKGELYKASNKLFLKPLTFMNLSGESVRAVMQFYKIDLDDLIVIHDDIDLNLGAIRFKKGGSNGGHNGLKSIDELLGRDYLRVRVGVGKPSRKSEVVSYVLTPFNSDEEIIVSKSLSI